MKYLKNIIRLIILISLSLSLAPLTSVKAANNALQVDTTTYNALDTETTSSTDDTTPSTTATSKVNVTVLSGLLSLEAVPDFNFGAMMQGATAKLQNNTADVSDFNTNSANGSVTAGSDGNSTGLLEIIDSRNFSSTMPGFTLTASMGAMTTSDGTTNLNAILKLGALALINDDNENISTSSTDLKTKSATIHSTDVDTGEAGNDATVIDLDKGSYNSGVIKANFNNSDSASLTLPDKVSSSDKNIKNMNSVITWTLTAKPTVN